MSEDADTPQNYPQLPCSALVYRLARKASWIDHDARKFKPSAFFRRPELDEDGLSVNPKDTCSLDEAIQISGLSRVRGAATLHTGRLRDHELDIVQDQPKHANIVGMPYEDEDDSDDSEANRIASLLSNQSRLVQPE